VAAVLDSFILERAPGPLVEIPAALVRARSAFGATLDAFLRIENDRLGSAWTSAGYNEEVRYGFYRVVELIESARSAAGRALEAEHSSEARDAAGAASASRWALQGVLATLGDDDLDADPGGGEWTIRQTLQHIINSQRGYAWGSAAWLQLGLHGDLGDRRLPEDTYNDFPEEDQEALGTLAQIRRELDDIVDATSARYASLTDAEMALSAKWSGATVSIAFRQWRWSSHIDEHTVQIEKTLDLLARRRAERDWLVRLDARAFGRLERDVFGRSSAGDAAPVLDTLARDLTGLYPQVVAAAEANIPSAES
jgi:uncharacterized damage-inducible protein DinB